MSGPAVMADPAHHHVHLTPQMLLGRHWDTLQKVSGWWMSEKLDGWRAYWNGERLISRNGKPLRAPAWWLKALPKGVHLDGELWAGRGTLGKIKAALGRRIPRDSEWRGIKYAVFDAPSLGGPFEARQAALRRLNLSGPVFVLDQIECDSRQHALETMRAIVAAGGEGVMLRKPGSAYERKRSYTLLKAKPRRVGAGFQGGLEAGFGPAYAVAG